MHGVVLYIVVAMFLVGGLAVQEVPTQALGLIEN